MSFGFFKWFQRKQTDGDKKKKKVNKQTKVPPVIRVHQYEEVDLPEDPPPQPRFHNYEDVDVTNSKTKIAHTNDYMAPVKRVHTYEDVDIGSKHSQNTKDNINGANTNAPVIYGNIQPEGHLYSNNANLATACVYENTANVTPASGNKNQTEGLNYIEVDFVKREATSDENRRTSGNQPPRQSNGNRPRFQARQPDRHEPTQYTTIEALDPTH